MPIIQSVQIVLVMPNDGGNVKVVVQTGTDQPVDTGIEAPTVAAAIQMIADKIGGKA